MHFYFSKISDKYQASVVVGNATFESPERGAVVGPVFYLLRLALEANEEHLEPSAGSITITFTPPLSRTFDSPIDKEAVLTQVLEGVHAANDQWGTHYNVISIFYSTNHGQMAPPEGVFRDLARAIMQKLASKEGWIEHNIQF